MTRSIPLFLILAARCGAASFDVAAFGRPCCAVDAHRLQTTFDYAQSDGLARHASGAWVWGRQWAEERDIAEVAVHLRAPFDAGRVRIQYWSHIWPYERPTSHTVEDPAEDPWQGSWLDVAATRECREGGCRFRFPALAESENPRAGRLPGVTYRRTIKLRLLFDGKPELGRVEVLTPSQPRRFAAHLRFGAAGEAEFSAYNGRIASARSAGREAEVVVDGADPKPAGSNDITVVKVRRGGRAFSFAPAELERGPIRIPLFDVTITGAGPAAPAATGDRIRKRLLTEPEQSYERAAREIPPLDPVTRSGGKLLLPMALDASWQKFGFEWGGHVLIGKRATKARGKELARLTWPGDTIAWRIGTGIAPTFRDETEASTLAQLEDYLPVGIARWRAQGLEFEEEAFATSPAAPLSPEDAGRDEQTPSVLLLRFTIRNPGEADLPADLWLALKPGEPLAFDGGLLTAAGGRAVRAALRLPAGWAAKVASCRDGDADVPALHLSRGVGARSSVEIVAAIPFIPELTGAERTRIAALDYAAERARIVAYWRGVTAGVVPFEVPEERFNTFAKGLVARIRLSATKDPASGLYMAPAASMRYVVYANEAAFQCQLLDLFGQHALARQYLKTLVALQGSKPLVGSFTGDQRDVYYGARVNADYDYTATPYNLSHGTVLWTLAQHYLVTRDRAWLAATAPSMKRAARWIVDQRALTQGQPGSPEYGLLPAGHLEDNRDWGHWFSVNAYASAGMTGLAEALEDAGDAEAAWFGEQARRYRDEFRAAVLRAAEDAPVVRLRDGNYVPYVPTMAHQRFRFLGPLRAAHYTRYGVTEMPTFRLAATRELLYGPLTLVDTGVFDAREPLAEWVLDDWEDNLTTSEPLGINVHGWVDEEYWFSRGGMVFQANLQNPIRTYLRRGEVKAALRSLYNSFVSCYYPSVNIFTEEYRRWRYPSGPFFKIPDEAKFVHRVRDLLVTEFDGDLHLAAGIPGNWLAGGKQIVVRQAPTEYGPVSYTLRAEGGEVRGTITLPARSPYRAAWISVRLPEGVRMAEVKLDGAAAEFDRATGRIRLPRTERPIALLVTTWKW